MSQRLDYYTTSPNLSKKLYELSEAVKKSSLGNTLLDLVNIRASQLKGVHSVLICIARKPRSMVNGSCGFTTSPYGENQHYSQKRRERRLSGRKPSQSSPSMAFLMKCTSVFVPT